MYTIINSLIASIKPVTAKYSIDAFNRLVELEKAADEYEGYDSINTRYSDMSEIDDITDELIADIENDFYTDENTYDTANAEKVTNAVYDIYSAFEEWTDEMSSNTHSVSFWNV